MKIFGLVIITNKEYKRKIESAFSHGWDRSDFHIKQSAWSAINPVIYDLERLRANTWDQDKITYIQEWLKDNFEVKDNYEQ